MLESRSAISSPASLRLKGACDRSTTSGPRNSSTTHSEGGRAGSFWSFIRGTRASSSAASRAASTRVVSAASSTPGSRTSPSCAERRGRPHAERRTTSSCVFEQDAYLDRAFATAAKALELPATGRSRSRRVRDGSRPHARPRDRGAGPPAGARSSMRPVGPRSDRRVPSRPLPRFRPGACRGGRVGQLVRAAGLERAVAFTGTILRRLADGIREVARRVPGRRRPSRP